MPDDQNFSSKIKENATQAAQRAQEGIASRLNSPGKVFGELFAAKTTKNNFTAPFKVFGFLFRRDVQAFKSLISDNDRPNFDFTGAETDEARYAFALEQSGNAGRIDQIHQWLNRNVHLYALMGTFFVCFGLIAAAQGGPLHDLVIGTLQGPVEYAVEALPFLVAVALFSYFLKFGFLSYQMRHRALLPLSTFLKKPSEWLNTSIEAGHITRSAIMVLIMMPVLQYTNFGIGQALAQAIPGALGGGSGAGASSSSIMSALTSSLGKGDLSFQWMTNLFPSYFQSATGVSYQSDAVAQLLDVMNVTIMGLGSLMLSYHTVSGLVSTAREGTFLGQKWHSVYAPIRIGMGAVGTVPIKGLSAASILLLNVIFAGCGLGNMTWDTYVNVATGQSSGAMAITLPPSTISQESAFYHIVQSAACYEAARYYFRAPSNGSVPAPLSPQQLDSKYKSPNGERPMFSYPSTSNSSTFDFGRACGGIALPNVVTASGAHITAPPLNSKSNIDRAAADAQQSSIIDNNAAITSAQTAFQNARNQAFSQFMNQLLASSYIKELAAGTVPGGTSTQTTNLISGLSTLQSQFANYESAVLKAAGQMQASINSKSLAQIRAKSQTLGWASAGAMEPQLIAAEAKVDNTFSAKPYVLSANPGVMGQKQFLAIYVSLQNQIQNAQANVQAGSLPALSIHPGQSGPSTVINSESALVAAITHNPNNFLSDLGQYNSTILEQYVVNGGELNTTNPMAQISSIGLEVKTVGYGALSVYEGALFAASGSKSAVKNTIEEQFVNDITGGAPVFLTSGVKTVLKSLGFLIDILSIWLITTGITMEYIIPLLGYTIWVSAILMYVLFCIEAVVGAGFWAFSHIRADGDEMINQHQSYGWRVMPVMIFYPSLMVLGLIIANVAMSAMIGFVNGSFTQALGGNGAIYDPFGLVAVLTLLAGIYYNIITRSYRLITMIPEWIMRWMGAEGVNRGDGGGEQVHGGAMTDTKAGVRSGINQARSNLNGSRSAVGVGGGSSQAQQSSDAESVVAKAEGFANQASQSASIAQSAANSAAKNS
jgi:conjugal transfer/type IV secretion protein DotA/TraY